MSNAVFPALVRGLDCNQTKALQFSTIIQKSPSGAATAIIQRQNPMRKWSLTYNYIKDNPLDIPSGLTYTDLQTLEGFIAARQGQGDDFLYDDLTDDFVGPALKGSSPNLQAQLQVVSDSTNPVSAVAIASGGTGFAIGDWLGVAGGGGTGAILQVNTLSGSAIASVIIVNGGSGYATTSGAALTVLSGSGSGSPTADITAVTLYYSPIQRNLGGQFYEDVTDLNGGIEVYDNGVAKSSPTDYSIAGPGLAFPGNSFAGLYLVWTAAPTGPVTAQFNFYFRVHFDMDERAFDQFMHSLWCLNGPEATNSDYLTFETWRPATA
jgi:hypothetical protein